MDDDDDHGKSERGDKWVTVYDANIGAAGQRSWMSCGGVTAVGVNRPPGAGSARTHLMDIR